MTQIKARFAAFFSLRSLLTLAFFGAAFTASAVIPKSGSYITSGLIGHWDAIDNAGAGVHDAEATTWADLSGNGYDFTLPDSGVTISDNVIQFAKVSAKATIPDFLTAGSYSLDAYVRADSDYTADPIVRTVFNSYPIALFFRDTSDGLLCCRYTRSGTAYFSLSTTKPSISDIQAWHTYHEQTTTSSAKLGLDGAAPSACSASFYNESCAAFNTASVGHSAVTLNYRSVRVYNRHLTADEVAHNRMVDVMRFEAGEPADGYRVAEDGSLEVRCAVTVKDGLSVRVNGEEYSADETLWLTNGTTITFVPVAPAGKLPYVIGLPKDAVKVDEAYQWTVGLPTAITVRLAVPGPETVTPKAYVTRDAICILDGLCNVTNETGGSEHKADAMWWNDLTGNGWDFQLRASSIADGRVTWGDACMQMNRKNGGNERNCAWSPKGRWYVNYRTIELVFQPKGCWDILDTGDSKHGFYAGGTTFMFGNRDIKCSLTAPTSTEPTYGANVYNEKSSSQSTSTMAGYINGVKKGWNSTYGDIGYGQEGTYNGLGGYVGEGSDYGGEGDLYALRIHDGQLTADEIAYNYAIDCIRLLDRPIDGYRAAADGSDTLELDLSVTTGAKTGFKVNGEPCTGSTNIWFKPNNEVTLVVDKVEGVTPVFKDLPAGVTKVDDHTLSITVGLKPIKISFSGSMDDRPTILTGIVSDGKQWFTTGHYATQNTKLEMSVTNPVFSAWSAYYGADNGSVRFLLCHEAGNTTRFWGYWNTAQQNMDVGKDGSWVFVHSSDGVYMNGTRKWAPGAATFQTQYPLGLLCANSGSSVMPAGTLFRYTKIWESGVLVRDYLPAKMNGEYGIYDFVNGTFVGSGATSGSFTPVGEENAALRVGPDGKREWRITLDTAADVSGTVNGVAFTGPTTYWAGDGTTVTVNVAQVEGKWLTWDVPEEGVERTDENGIRFPATRARVQRFTYATPTLYSGLDSDGKQWIDTHYYPNNKTTLEIAVTNQSGMGWTPYLWGASGGGDFMVYHKWDNPYYYCYWAGQNSGGWKGYSYSAGARYVFRQTPTAITCNGSTMWTYSTPSATFQCTQSLGLLCVNKGSSVFPNVRLDYAKIWERDANNVDVIKRDYIAAEVGGVYGLYDYVTGFFYPSGATSGSFTPVGSVTDQRVGVDGGREWRVPIVCAADTAYTIDGTDYVGPQTAWLDDNVEHTIVVKPAEGQHVTWTGVPQRADMSTNNHVLVWNFRQSETIGFETSTLTFPEYVDFTGDQCIQTTVMPTKNTRAFLDFTPFANAYSSSGSDAWTVAMTNAIDATTVWRFGNNGNHGPRFRITNAENGGWWSHYMTLNVRWLCSWGSNIGAGVWTGAGPQWYVYVTNAVSGVQYYGGSGTGNQNYYLASQYLCVGYRQKMRFYSLRFWDFIGSDSTRSLLAEYIPCVKGGVAGFYDLKHGSFTTSTEGAEKFVTSANARRLDANGAFEYATRVTAPPGGRFTVNGTEYTGSAEVYAKAGTAMTFVAKVAEGASIKLTAKPKGATVDGNTVTWTVTEGADLAYTIDLGELNAYVQTGLVAWWDALNPIGDGTAAVTAGRWIDLKDATRYWDVANYNYSAATRAYEVPNRGSVGMGGTSPSGVKTVESHVRWDQGRKFITLAQNNTGLGFSPVGHIGRRATAMSASRAAEKGKAMTYAIACPGADSISSPRFYRNGVDLGASRKYVPAQNEGNNANHLGGRYYDASGTSQAYFMGGIHAIRLYNRQLSADEAKRNAALDEVRFHDGAWPTGLKLEGGKLWVRYDFATTAALTIETNDVVLVDAEVPAGAYWVEADSVVKVTAAPGEGEIALFTGVPQEATYADATLTFTANWPHTVAVEIVAPDATLTSNVGVYSYPGATVLVNAAITATSIEAGRLIVGTGAATASVTVSGAVNISGDLDVCNRATLVVNKSSAVGGDLSVRAGGYLTHTARGTTTSNTNLVDIVVAGDLLVENGGYVHANSRGWQGQTAANLAGKVRLSGPLCGGFGNNGCAGGVVRLNVAGDAQVDGILSAVGTSTSEYGAPSGGSVWLTAKTLAGEGIVDTSAGAYWHSSGGGQMGGWISLELTGEGATFAGFKGHMISAGGCQAQGAQTSDKCSNAMNASGPIYLKDGTGYVKLLLRDGNVDSTSDTAGNFRRCSYPGSIYDKTENLTVDDVVCEFGSKLRITADGTLRVRGDIKGEVDCEASGEIAFLDSDQESLLTGGAQKYGRFTCEAAGKTIRFGTAAGDSFSILDGGRITVTGAEGSPVSLLASPDGAAWTLNLGGNVTRNINVASVSNSTAVCASSAVPLLAYDSKDLGGNVGWKFVSSQIIIVPGEPIVWTGANGVRWMDLLNWDLFRNVAETDDVYVGANDENGDPLPNGLTLVDSYNEITQTVNKLTFFRKADVTLNGADFTVTNKLTVADARFTLKGAVGMDAANVEVGADGTFVIDAGTFAVSDTLTVKAGGTLALTNGTLTVKNLVLEEGANVSFGSGAVTVTGDLTVEEGALLKVGTATMTLEGNVTFGAADVFVCGTGTIILAGDADVTVDFADATLNNLRVTKEAGTLTFAGGWTATKFDCTATTDLTIAFAAGKTFTVDTLNLEGTVGEAAVLTLQSTTAGEKWNLNVTGVYNVFGVTVTDSDASGGVRIDTCSPSSCTDCTNWKDDVVFAKWLGGTGNWNTAEKWSTGVVPDGNTRVSIKLGSTVTIPNGAECAALSAGGAGSAVALSITGAMVVSNSFELANQATMTFSTNKRMEIGGGFYVRNGATITHTENPSDNDQAYKVNIHAVGDAVIEAGGKIYVANGFPCRAGQGYNNSGAHGGGRWGNDYGSISAPTNCGSGGWTHPYGKGGGVIRFFTDGSLTVNGEINASAPNNGVAMGAGGSVWLGCEALVGSGSITANGGYAADYSVGSGAGGRIAIWFSGDDPQADWTGSITAYGGDTRQSRMAGAAGTIYLQPNGGTARDATLIVKNCKVSRAVFDDGNRTKLSASVGASEIGNVIIGVGARVYVPEGETIKVYGSWSCDDTTYVYDKTTYRYGEFLTVTDNKIEFCGDAEATISGYTTFRRFVCNVPGKTLKFAPATATTPNVMSVQTRLELNGEDGALLNLVTAGDDPEATWGLSLVDGVMKNVNFVSVENSIATASANILAYDSEGKDCNERWVFDAEKPEVEAGENLYWLGVGTLWQSSDNWENWQQQNREPCGTDHLHISTVTPEQASVVNMPLLDINVKDQTINKLTVENGAAVVVNGAGLTVTNELAVDAATLMVKGATPMTAAATVVKAGGVLTVSANTFTGDSIVVEDGGTLIVTNAATLAVGDLTLESGATALFDTGTVTVEGDLTVGEHALLAMTTATLNLKGDATFAAADGFAAGFGYVFVNGDDDQTLDFAGNAFNELTVQKDSGDVTFSAGFSAAVITCQTDHDLTLAFGAGETFDFETINFNGASGDVALLKLVSSGSGDWFLKANAHDIFGVIVENSDATLGDEVLTMSPSEGTNCQNWNFNAKVSSWVGGDGTKSWNTAANWSRGEVPDGETVVKINSTSSLSLDIPDGTVIDSLSVAKSGGTVSLRMLGSLEVTNNVDLAKGATLTANSKKPTNILGNLFVRTGALVTHTQNPGSESYCVNLVVAGDALVVVGGRISVIGRGVSTGGSTHGGEDRWANASYDAVLEPCLSGRKNYFYGGGVIFMKVAGTLTANGVITADGDGVAQQVEYNGGSGGTINVKCGALAGYGTFSATGSGSYHSGTPGGGGRVAIQLTTAGETFEAFRAAGGSITAMYGVNNQYNSVEAQAGYGTVSLRYADGSGEIRIGEGTNCPYPGKSNQNSKLTDLPMADDGDAARAYRNQTLVIVNRGRVKLTGDMTVRDLELYASNNSEADYKKNLLLNGHTLFILSRKHVNGRGWYNGWSNYVDYSGGQIKWISNTVIRIR